VTDYQIPVDTKKGIKNVMISDSQVIINFVKILNKRPNQPEFLTDLILRFGGKDDVEVLPYFL
jgi:hypothetical protein